MTQDILRKKNELANLPANSSLFLNWTNDFSDLLGTTSFVVHRHV